MSFAGDIDRFQANIRASHRANCREVMGRVYQGVTTQSPVDTGRFKASWRMSWGRLDRSVEPPADHVPFMEQQTPKPDDDFPSGWVSNALPYAVRLEEGWSGDAPAGVVAVTLAAVEAFYA